MAKELTRLYGTLDCTALGPEHLAPPIARWQHEYAKNTRHNRTKALRRILRDIRPIIGKDLTASVPRVGPAKPPQLVVTPDERDRILQHGPQWLKLFVLLCSDLALRFEEARTANLSGYNRDTATLTFQTKGGDTNTLPVTDELKRIIESISTTGDKPMLELLAGKPIRRDAIRYEWHKAKKAAGVNMTIRPHDLRRTAATNLWRMTKDIRLVQQLLGHRNLHATARYIVDRDPQLLRPILESLKPITETKQ